MAANLTPSHHNQGTSFHFLGLAIKQPSYSAAATRPTPILMRSSSGHSIWRRIRSTSVGSTVRSSRDNEAFSEAEEHLLYFCASVLFSLYHKFIPPSIQKPHPAALQRVRRRLVLVTDRSLCSSLLAIPLPMHTSGGGGGSSSLCWKPLVAGAGGRAA
ncbi:hypothetical protein BDP27DRAFT_1366259 [Rhodocollybia butyracea]|uniref:Uncharacterized protein n=1 Tax=Rhodocollybia butyracea TaxID=206335 RepID=A0A9P5PHA1_9AGAR|nr:hypothetical protein BDP27DRAFT_1366259 [Rhodocollybia butyracea]